MSSKALLPNPVKFDLTLMPPKGKRRHIWQQFWWLVTDGTTQNVCKLNKYSRDTLAFYQWPQGGTIDINFSMLHTWKCAKFSLFKGYRIEGMSCYTVNVAAAGGWSVIEWCSMGLCTIFQGFVPRQIKHLGVTVMFNRPCTQTFDNLLCLNSQWYQKNRIG